MDQQNADAMQLYQRCISSAVVEYVQKQMKVKMRDCVYTAPVVIWLMICQWLQPKGTLATTVERLSEGAADSLLSRRARLRRKGVSRRTGGYSHARQRLPKLLCKKVTQELILRLRQILNPEGQSSAYLLDGSSLELEASPGLRRAYPPAENQHGFVMNVVDTCWHKLQTAADAKSYQRAVFAMLDTAAQGTHPKRRKRRCYPRAAWNRRHTFPTLKERPHGLT